MAKQTSTSSNTCEAETVSMSSALRKEALQLQEFFSSTFKRSVKLICEEDNTQAIIAAKKGYSPVMRHLARTHRISVGVLGESFGPESDGTAEIRHCPTVDQKGDLFTKRLDKLKFQRSLELINMKSSRAKI